MRHKKMAKTMNEKSEDGPRYLAAIAGRGTISVRYIFVAVNPEELGARLHDLYELTSEFSNVWNWPFKKWFSLMYTGYAHGAIKVYMFSNALAQPKLMKFKEVLDTLGWNIPAHFKDEDEE